MKEIGVMLKNKREENGLSIEEVADDLKRRPSQIEHIENGDLETFSDIYALKYFVRDYAKYLGLDEEKIMDDFNEFLFDHTSKISLDDIEKAKNEVSIKKIVSPYTKIKTDHTKLKRIVLYVILGIIFLALMVLIIKTIIGHNNPNNDDFINNSFSYYVGKLVLHSEFA